MKTIPVLVLLILISTPVLTQMIPGSNIDTDYYYWLKSESGDYLSLEANAINNRLELATTERKTHQYWRFTPDGQGSYRLTCLLRGTAWSIGVNKQNNEIVLQNYRDTTSQQWKVLSVQQNTVYYLTLEFRVPRLSRGYSKYHEPKYFKYY